ncbi:MFS transporter, partial [Dactylosporangium sp. NPDC005572]|uniref:MFS transporter n=1 Tax=Dactylosporangium sp. NPDC005572 TaxID=3156889 RepID=UPI0033AA8903
MDATVDERVTPLRADPAWRRFLLARAVSWSGSALTLVALPMLMFQATGSPALTALLTAVEALPYLLFGLFAGAYADRWDRRRIMVLTSVAEAVLLAGIPAAAALDILTPGHIVAVAAACATAAVFFDAASFAALPALVGRARIARATAASVSTADHHQAGDHQLVGVLLV